MEKQSVKKIILFSLFCLVFFGCGVLTLFIIDANLWGWIFLSVLAGTFVWFRFSKFWEQFLCGKFAWLKKLCVFLFVIAAIGANNRLSRPDLSVSYKGTLIREMIREMRNLPVMKGDGMLVAGAKLSSQGSAWKAPVGYKNHKKLDCRVPIEVLEKEGSVSKKLIFQIHGGAYVIGMIDSYRSQAVRFSKLADDASVLNIDYRIAPAHTYPAALEDALEVWDWILEHGWKAQDVIVAGDSAGGNLALALCMKLRDSGRELPGKMILMSPWADLASTGPSHKTHMSKDPMFGDSPHSYKKSPVRKETEKTGKKSMTALYAGDADLFDPYLSPLHGDFTGFPKMLVQVGTFEVLLSDSQIICEKAKACGVDARLQEYEGMYHVFQQLGDMIPESKKAWKEIEKFCKE